MSEFALSSSPEENQNMKKMGFSSLLLSDFQLFCSFIISHPFYFSYVLFFSPYMFKILSFLSPLFVTTTLLLLALLSTLHLHDTFPDSESLETQPSFLVAFCSKIGSVLEPKFDVNSEDVNELEAYKMVVEACSMKCASEDESMEVTFVDKFCSHEVSTVVKKESVENQPLKLEDQKDLEKEEETEKCETKEVEDQKVKLESDVVLDNGEGQFWKEPTKEESKAQKVDLVGDCNDLPKLSDFLGEEKKNKVNDQKEEEEEEEDVSLKSFGSMRKEKEWRRTLACKLFEERHNADVGQGMDQLWETYETETEKKQTEEEKKKEKEKEKEKKKTKKSMMMKTKSIEKKEAVVEEEEDDDGIDQQQLCCLQALKFSTGKMHLGIARPNLVKLSKAFKGFGRFYNANKHPKKA